MIKLLDCTLRDGAHVNGGNFGEETIKGIVKKLDSAGIDYIEVGFLTNLYPEREGYTHFRSITDVEKYIPARRNAKVSLMVRPDQCNLSQIDKKYDHIDTIRFAFHKKDLDLTLSYMEHSLNLGYEVCANPVNILSYSIDEIQSVIRRLSILDVSCISIVDTFGALKEGTFKNICSIFHSELPIDTSFGLHLHDNLLQSFGLVCSYLESQPKIKTVIDSSLHGMGRAPGNLCTELIAAHLSNYGNEYNVGCLLEAISSYIYPMKEKYQWGYHPVYMLTGEFNVHRDYGEYLINNEIDLPEIYNILENISRSSFSSYYNKEYIISQLEKEND